MAVGVEAAHGLPLPKNRATDSAPLGGNGPQYEGTVALDEYPFGKRLNTHNRRTTPCTKHCRRLKK